ncbi:hypothetical protein L7F22_036834 [Adiantum nelumboides]|nr:hypothetical protein [Adiantum nelumboides]MCO5582931.1 hypothetical protein [Adiantum nelumboides]
MNLYRHVKSQYTCGYHYIHVELTHIANQPKTRHSTCNEIHVTWNNALVITRVITLPSLSRDTNAMSTVVKKENIAGFGACNKLLESTTYVGTCRLHIAAVCVDEYTNVRFGKAKALDQAFVDAIYVVDASLKLSFGCGIVASHKNSPLHHG